VVISVFQGGAVRRHEIIEVKIFMHVLVSKVICVSFCSAWMESANSRIYFLVCET